MHTAHDMTQVMWCRIGGQQKAYETSGALKQVAFQTIPSVSKVTRRDLC